MRLARVRVTASFDEEPELHGMTGDLIRVGDDGTVGVFLDGDKLPTTFLSGEVEVLS